jgi:hypothetical protein
MSRASWMVRASFPALTLAAALVSACGGGGSNPASSSAAPDVRGTYAGNVAWTTHTTTSPGQASFTEDNFAYSGRITIDSQTGSAFSGTFLIEGQASGVLTRGTVDSSGALSFELPDPAGGPHPGTETWSEACSVAFDSVLYTGRIDGAAFEASRSQRYSCPKAGLVSVSMTFNGQK